jgi:multicomponent K+:H+ antiporter subunit F
LVVVGLWQGHQLAFEVALLIALLGFIGTVVLAKFISRGDIVE